MKKIVKKSLQIKLTLLLLGFMAFVMFTLFTSKTDKLLGIQSFVVLTGSMSPLIPQGSIIFTIKAPEYKVGDIITYRQNNSIITHRVSEALVENGTILYKTKGDANNSQDASLVKTSDILGKAENRIPYIGNFVLFLKTLPGFLIFVILPISLFIAYEIWNIKKEFEKSIEKKVLRQIQGV